MEGRAHPSGLTPEWGPPPGLSTAQILDGINQPPEIELTVEEAGNGFFLLSGRVLDEDPDGLIVYFGGTVGSVQGLTAVCDDEGYFSILVKLKTDGSDEGSITARVTDRGGLSDEDSEHVNPTPP